MGNLLKFLNSNFFSIAFVCSLALTRLIPHPPNFTPIIATSVLGPLLLKNRLYGMMVPVFAMFLSDLFIGFHAYQLVIYITLISIALFAPMRKNIKYLAFTALGASVWFFIITNFAVWITWDFYPKTFEGLITCYTLAIPFFQNTLISTCIFTGLITFFIKHIEALNEKINYFIFKSYTQKN